MNLAPPKTRPDSSLSVPLTTFSVMSLHGDCSVNPGGTIFDNSNLGYDYFCQTIAGQRWDPKFEIILSFLTFCLTRFHKRLPYLWITYNAQIIYMLSRNIEMCVVQLQWSHQIDSWHERNKHKLRQARGSCEPWLLNLDIWTILDLFQVATSWIMRSTNDVCRNQPGHPENDIFRILVLSLEQRRKN